jgi:hypothetical protein
MQRAFADGRPGSPMLPAHDLESARIRISTRHARLEHALTDPRHRRETALSYRRRRHTDLADHSPFRRADIPLENELHPRGSRQNESGFLVDAQPVRRRAEVDAVSVDRPGPLRPLVPGRTLSTRQSPASQSKLLEPGLTSGSIAKRSHDSTFRRPSPAFADPRDEARSRSISRQCPQTRCGH